MNDNQDRTSGARKTAKPVWQSSRAFGLAIIFLTYLLALLVGLIVFDRLPYSLWLSLLLADITATLIVWLSSLVFDNASVYDPYWSVQPVIILDLLLFQAGLTDPAAVSICLVVNLWGVRLTANWITTFRNLEHQDWRYDLIKSKTNQFYPLASLLGIQLMPTLVVYACIIPAVIYLEQAQTGRFNILSVAGLVVSSSGLILETLADRQMHIFRRENPDRSQVNRNGLWHDSRHPNYLGEILMWWGVYLVMLSAMPKIWYLGFGALLNTAMFLYISIPMAEKNLASYKENYTAYQKQTRMLLPLPKK
jgi:steroid 5-alpha reductase family enzyme